MHQQQRRRHHHQKRTHKRPTRVRARTEKVRHLPEEEGRAEGGGLDGEQRAAGGGPAHDRRDRADDGADPRVERRALLHRRVHTRVEAERRRAERGRHAVGAEGERADAGDPGSGRPCECVLPADAPRRQRPLRSAVHRRVVPHFNQLVEAVGRCRAQERATERRGEADGVKWAGGHEIASSGCRHDESTQPTLGEFHVNGGPLGRSLLGEARCRRRLPARQQRGRQISGGRGSGGGWRRWCRARREPAQRRAATAHRTAAQAAAQS